MPPFKVVADFQPAGDQPDAINGLVERVREGDRYTTLLGATGTGDWFSLPASTEPPN